MQRHAEKTCDRYITDAEFQAVHGIATPLMQGLMDLAYLTALRRGDLLRIHLSDLADEGIKITTNKTKKKILIEWTADLQLVINKIKLLPRPARGLSLFCNQKGQPYTDSRISCLWQKLMNKALQTNVIAERFTFQDIRRKAATDVEKNSTRENARKLLGHTTQNTTARYIGGVSKVKPVK